jgi:hypothetical protein
MLNSFCRISAALLAAAVLCLSSANPAQAAIKPGWRVVQVYGSGAADISPATSPASPGALVAPSAKSAWAIFEGCTWPCSGPAVSFLVRWNGNRWERVAASAILGLQPGFLAASSPSDVWVLGQFPNATTPGAVHWNGKHWTRMAVPKWLYYANGAGETELYTADFSARNVWVFSLGSFLGQKSAYASRYLNGHWTKMRLPDVPYDVTAVSDDDIWALGAPLSGGEPTVLMHWSGRHWKVSRFPHQKEAGTADGLEATGPDNLWSSWFPSKAGRHEYLLHWTGKGWSRVALPARDTTLSFIGDGHGGLWVTGVGPNPKQTQLFMQWSASGWTVRDVPSAPGLQLGQVDELALISGTRSMWAIGHLYGPGAGTTLNRGAIWRYNP